jgi:hypothetical protein
MIIYEPKLTARFAAPGVCEQTPLQVTLLCRPVRLVDAHIDPQAPVRSGGFQPSMIVVQTTIWGDAFLLKQSFTCTVPTKNRHPYHNGGSQPASGG